MIRIIQQRELDRIVKLLSSKDEEAVRLGKQILNKGVMRFSMSTIVGMHFFRLFIILLMLTYITINYDIDGLYWLPFSVLIIGSIIHSAGCIIGHAEMRHYYNQEIKDRFYD